MMCQKSCGRTVEGALKSVRGTTSVMVDFTTSSATISGTALQENVLIDAVESVGFDAVLMKSTVPNIILNISGMMCQNSCGKTVANALSSVSGVALSEVDFPKGEALVWGVASADDLIDSVENVGFDAAVSTATLKHTGVRNTDPDLIIKIVNFGGNSSEETKSIETAIQKIDGVFTASVNTKQGTVEISGFPNLSEVLGVLKDLSYEGIEYESYKEAQKKLKAAKKEASIRTPSVKTPYAVATLKITGMSCAACVRTIEETVIKHAGVKSVRVALLSGRAQVVFDPLLSDPDDVEGSKGASLIRSLVQSIGYSCDVIEVHQTNVTSASGMESNNNVASPLHEKKIVLSISGMSCANCALKIEKTLMDNPGISSASVSVMTNKAVLMLDEVVALSSNPIGVRDVIKIVEDLGYGCKFVDESNDVDAGQDGEEDVLLWRKMLIVAAILGIPVVLLHAAMSVSTTFMELMSEPVVCNNGITLGQVLMLVLNTPLVAIVGYKFFRGAFLGAMHRSFGMDFLITTGVSVTFIYSIIQLCMACYSGMPSMHVFLEISGMLLLFVSLGKYIEAYARLHTASAISDLLKLQPATVGPL